ncbi:MAG TPA: carboxypeptidase M32 [Chlamydiales bacterium]|jgi:carboxypeptidase Taq|nr:carboxypeptidase M32 [Chlamydiales bacterium]
MAEKKDPLYDALLEKSKTIHVYHSVLNLLHWDQETCMPPGGIQLRSEQIAQLSRLVHEEKTAKSYKHLLEKLVNLRTGTIKAKNLTKTQKIIVREWRKDYVRANKLPVSFVKTFSQLTSEATQIWAIAKKENNFKLFAPYLEKIVKMNREKAAIWGFSDHPYDALLENHEPCMTSARCSKIFDGLQGELKHLLKKIEGAKKPDVRFLHRKIADDKQREIGLWISNAMPVNSDYTRLDLSSHPFSMSLSPRDSRITTRYLPHAFMSNIFSVLHEMGHSMYEMGLPIEHWGTALCEAASLSVHESQSRWWETFIGRSLSFWKHFYPKLQKILPSLKTVSFEKFYRAVHLVTPSFIRVEADEVTYCLHVVLRFEIEKQLIAGSLSVPDLPEAWNAKFKELFGITPPSDAQGCLQDVHWALGEFGYFPTYALGNILAAHLFSAFSKAHPDWSARLELGELSFIRDWLKEHIHRWGRIYNFDELAKRATGKPISEEAYCQYLKKKYSEIYKL